MLIPDTEINTTFSTTTISRTLTNADHVVFVDATAFNIFITLPLSSSDSARFGKIYKIKKIDSTANQVTIQTTGPDLLDAADSITLLNQYDFVEVICNRTSWRIVGGLTRQPTIADFTNSQHTHGSAFQGGALSITKARMYLVGAQSIGNAVTKVLLDTDSYDPDNITDPVTNHRITPKKSGWYQVEGAILYNGTAAAGNCITFLYKNGVVVAAEWTLATAATQAISAISSDLIFFNGTTDYIELFGQMSGGATSLGAANYQTYLSVVGPF